MDRAPILGFSLIELLTALAIVAILATVTVPSFSGLVAKSRRSDAHVFNVTGRLLPLARHPRRRDRFPGCCAALGAAAG
jgi:prepilin-type N-terminal cleavage/methylation domain-containing protein